MGLDLALSASSLTFTYRSELLRFPDISLSAGESCAVIGPSGCGKSTLLHLIAGLLTPNSGSITVAGQRMDAISQSERDRLRGQSIGIVLQQLHLIRSLSAVENLLLAQRLGRQPSSRTAASDLLSRLGLAHRLHHRPHKLSQGEAQRVAIARAILCDPLLILADEPTSSLDAGNAHQVLGLLAEQARTRNAALLVVTHDDRIRGQLDKEILLGGGDS